MGTSHFTPGTVAAEPSVDEITSRRASVQTVTYHCLDRSKFEPISVERRYMGKFGVKSPVFAVVVVLSLKGELFDDLVVQERLPEPLVFRTEIGGDLIGILEKASFIVGRHFSAMMASSLKPSSSRLNGGI